MPKGTDTALLQGAWVGYLASTLFGLLALMALTGTLGAAEGDINRGTTRILAAAQVVLFFVALVITLLFGTKVF